MQSHKDKRIEGFTQRSKEENADNVGQILGEIVKALHQQFRKQFHQFTGNHEFTVPQIFLLRILVANGPTSISALAERLNLANSTVSGIVDRLERDGYVTRVRDDDDRRIVYVQLTEMSEHLKQQVPQFQQKFLSELLRGIDEEQLAQMEESLQTLYDLIKRFPEENSAGG